MHRRNLEDDDEILSITRAETEELVNYVGVNYTCGRKFSNYFRHHTFTDGYKFHSKQKERTSS